MDDKKIICDKCGETFTLRVADLENVTAEPDIVTTFYRCPHCGEKYHAFTSDTAMREMVARRRTLRKEIEIAGKKRFRSKAIERKIREDNEIKAKQQAMVKSLREKGLEAMKRLDGKGGGQA